MMEMATTTSSQPKPSSSSSSLSEDKPKQRRPTFTEFVESSFASVERLCHPISSGALESKKDVMMMNSHNSTTTSTIVNKVDQESMMATISKNTTKTNNNSKSNKPKPQQSNHSSNNININNNTNEEDDEEDEAFATLTYLTLLSSLYLPLLLFLWIRRSMFGTASLCRSLFFGHMLRLIVAFTLLPPSTTKSFVPTWLWNLGIKIGNVAEKVWNDKRTQKLIPTWFHLILAIVLGVENEDIPSSLTLANLGSGGGSGGGGGEKDGWPPPSLVALGIFTVLAFVVHPDGLTWIMLGQIRQWIQNTFEKTRDGIHMIKDGTIKITLAELSGVIAGIIIIVTIFRAVINTTPPTEKVRAPHREKRGHKHKKGKKGKGGRHHQRSSADSGKSTIKSGGHYRSSRDLYEPDDNINTTTTATPRSRSSSPSTRDRSESDMVATAVSTLSDSGNVTCYDFSASGCNEKQNIDSVKDAENHHVENVRREKSVEKSVKKPSDDCTISTVESNKNVTSKSTKSKSTKSSDISNSPKHQFDHSHANRTTKHSEKPTNGEKPSYADKQKRGHGRKNRKSKLSNVSSSVEKQRDDGYGGSGSGNSSISSGNTKLSTPKRTQKTHARARKNNSEGRYRNQRAKDFECDSTVGSTASCSISEQFQSSKAVAGLKASPARWNYDSFNPVNGLGHSNRGRSFTDPQASLSKHSLPSPPKPQCLSLNARSNSQTVGGTNEMYQSLSRNLHSSQEAEGSTYRNSCYNGLNSERMHTQQQQQQRQLQNNQMYSQQHYGQFVGHTTNSDLCVSSTLNGGNGTFIRPPPGLTPQNSSSSSSMFASDLVVDNSSQKQTLPYMSSSTISTYSNFSTSSSPMDAVALNNVDQASNEQFNMSSSSGFNAPSQRNVTLPPISPLKRPTPPPIGHERTAMHDEDEIDADVLALGGLLQHL